jgi:hypothetical protein
MIDLNRDSTGKTWGAGCSTWCPAAPGRPTRPGPTSGDAFRKGVKVAALDLIAGCKTTIDDNLEDAPQSSMRSTS